MKRPHSKIARREGGGPWALLLGPRDDRILLWRVYYTGREWGLADWTGLVVLLPPPRHRTTTTTTITTTTTTTYHHAAITRPQPPPPVTSEQVGMSVANKLPLRQLGTSGLHVTPVCLGSMTWGMQNSEKEAHAQLDYAIKERGVNFIDTAEMYPVPSSAPGWAPGRTEEYIVRHTTPLHTYLHVDKKTHDTHTYTRTRTHARARKHTYAHAHMNTRTETRTHAHTGHVARS